MNHQNLQAILLKRIGRPSRSFFNITLLLGLAACFVGLVPATADAGISYPGMGSLLDPSGFADYQVMGPAPDHVGPDSLLNFACPLPQENTVTQTAATSSEAGHFLALYEFKPIYFLFGNPYTKIEISFESRMVKDLPIYFGYSQLMMWDLFQDSPYFADLNYNPLAWYRLQLDHLHQEFVDLIPFEHESNGKGGELERSWNRVGLVYHRSDLWDSTPVEESLKVWAPINYNPKNLNLAQYRGIWELTLKASGFMKSISDFNDFIFRLYPGGPSQTDPFHGGQEITFRFQGRNHAFIPFTILQVFHGVGENMQDYQLDQWVARIGMGF